MYINRKRFFGVGSAVYVVYATVVEINGVVFRFVESFVPSGIERKRCRVSDRSQAVQRRKANAFRPNADKNVLNILLHFAFFCSYCVLRCVNCACLFTIHSGGHAGRECSTRCREGKSNNT